MTWPDWPTLASISPCNGSTSCRRTLDIRLSAPNPGAATILALHGGGFLGYFSACIATALQERRVALGATGPLGRSFDAICGTSVGAILAAGIATNTPPADILHLMDVKGEEIFPRRRFLPTWPGIHAARFKPAPLLGLLGDILGPIRLGEIDRVLVIPAINETVGRPVIFRSANPAHWDVRLADVVMASAAAPLFLPLHRIGGDRYTDGGLVANAPALIASADLSRTFRIPTSRQRVVSIGTTRNAPRSAVKSHIHDRWGGVRWIWGGGRLQQLLMSCQEDLQSELLAGLGPAGRLHLDIELPADEADKVHMVKADAEAREVLGSAVVACLAAISSEQRGFLDRALARQARTLAWRPAASGRALPVLV